MRIKINNLKRVKLCAEGAKKYFLCFLRKFGDLSIIVCKQLAPKAPKIFGPSNLRGGGGGGKRALVRGG